ncbi:hypothetical protein PIB30_025484 [Stylosanthes scabra]|uniref:Uncharacterized protein n=1 Tax=Stylosanthes scabra TaxID=79078 RepID=A0ABU6WBZ5_9FABA|nr:hypothetical protein [Stylosanthes scabra]
MVFKKPSGFRFGSIVRKPAGSTVQLRFSYQRFQECCVIEWLLGGAPGEPHEQRLSRTGRGSRPRCTGWRTRLTNDVPTTPNHMLRSMTDFSSSRVTTGYIWNTTEVGDRNQMPSLSRPISPF